MSGGSYDYAYRKIEDIELEKTKKNKRRLLFQKLLKLVAKAMHDIEWVDSSDYSDGDENEAIDACLNFLKGDAKTKWKALAYDEVVDLVMEKEEELV